MRSWRGQAIGMRRHCVRQRVKLIVKLRGCNLNFRSCSGWSKHQRQQWTACRHAWQHRGRLSWRRSAELRRPTGLLPALAPFAIRGQQSLGDAIEFSQRRRVNVAELVEDGANGVLFEDAASLARELAKVDMRARALTRPCTLHTRAICSNMSF